MEKCIIRGALLFVLAITVVGCGESGENGDGLPVIDVAGSLGIYRQVPMSELISDAEYVPLETRPECMVGGSLYYVTATDDRIFIHSGRYCYAFTRKGKFITEIGKRGNGPGEYSFIGGLSVDEDNDRVYIEAMGKIMEYTSDGDYVRSFDKPQLFEKETFGEWDRPQRITPIRDNVFLGNVPNHLGNTPYNWAIFDTAGVVKTFPRELMMEKSERFISTSFGAPKPLVTSDGAYIKEYLNDTLFLLNRRDELIPKFVFSLGRYAFQNDVYLTGENMQEIRNNAVTLNESLILSMFVTRRNVFFSAQIGDNLLSGLGLPQGVKSTMTLQGRPIETDDTNNVLGLYDIRSGKTELLDRDPVTRRWGLVNDLDGGLSFWPRCYNESANELLDIWEAYQMKEFLTEEYFAAHPARDPAANARLRELVKNLTEDSNPVIVIAKLKK